MRDDGEPPPDDASGSDSAASSRVHIPLWLAALVTFTGPLSMHIFVPALPIAAADFGVGAPAMQATISLYIVGLAFGQLIYGPISDRFGRRPTLMAGFALYLAASIIALIANSVTVLIWARLFQALGAGAGLVLGRTIVRDTAGATDAARRLALMNMMVVIGPGVAPLIGGLMAETVGWRPIFVFLCVLGVFDLLLTWRLLPETAVVSRAVKIGLLPNYLRLLRSPAFLGYAIGGGCATTAVFGFIVAAPFIYVHELKRPVSEVGIYLTVVIFGIWIGNLIASRLIPRVPMRRLMVAGNGVSVCGAFLLLAGVLAGYLSVPLTLIAMFLFTLGVGASSSAALTEAVSVNPMLVGSASGLYGFAQMSIGALSTALVGLGANPALSAALVLSAAGIVAQLSFWIASRRWE